MQSIQITTPADAVEALAMVAGTARQIFCIDEPPLPTLLCDMTWYAEEIAEAFGLPESAMDNYRRAVFNEHRAGTVPMTAQELRNAQAALLEYVQRTLPDESNDTHSRLMECSAGWNEMIEAAPQEAAS